MEVTQKIELTSLFEIYNSLLTKKQVEIFELYYYEDFSILEISASLEITKNAVYNTLQVCEKNLNNFEEKLQVKAKYNYNKSMLIDNNIADSIIEQLR